MDLTALEAALVAHHPAALYLIPTFDNPTGATLSHDRRARYCPLPPSIVVVVPFSRQPYYLIELKGPLFVCSSCFRLMELCELHDCLVLSDDVYQVGQSKIMTNQNQNGCINPAFCTFTSHLTIIYPPLLPDAVFR